MAIKVIILSCYVSFTVSYRILFRLKMGDMYIASPRLFELLYGRRSGGKVVDQ
jgi:hypothetical protein